MCNCFGQKIIYIQKYEENKKLNNLKLIATDYMDTEKIYPG